ncbi:MAG: aminotransferase class I/II-fold pyridoxal phosphate-dependent enzyme, partial [Flavobacteriaceae bacterium]
ILNKIKPPYNVNQLTQYQALKRVLDDTLVQEEVAQILKERETLVNALKEVTFIKKIHSSDANFVLVKVDDANKRYQQLLDANVVVRNRSNQPLCENTLRFTVGTPDENKKLIAILKELN